MAKAHSSHDDDVVFYSEKLTLRDIEVMLGLPKYKLTKRKNTTPDKAETNTSERLPGPFETQSEPNLRPEEYINTKNTTPDKAVSKTSELLGPFETQSEPNLRPEECINTSVVLVSGDSFELGCSPNPLTETILDESFEAMENLVEKLCLSPRKSDCTELNNTLEIIDYILQHGAEKENQAKQQNKIEQEKIDNTPLPDLKKCNQMEQKICSKDEELISFGSPLKTNIEELPNEPTIDKSDFKINTTKAMKPIPTIIISDTENDHLKLESIDNETNDKTPKVWSTPNNNTPSKVNTDIGQFKTPNTKQKLVSSKKTAFKTPTCRSVKKATTPRNVDQCNDLQSPRLPGKSKFGHIMSPIANYIRNPQIPQLQQVQRKKVLASVSSIPKLVKSGGEAKKVVENKENVCLPTVAYKNPKITKVIAKDTPKINTPKKLLSKTPSQVPTVMTHQRLKSVKKTLVANLEDTVTNLTSYQADESLCTQKTAFNFAK